MRNKLISIMLVTIVSLSFLCTSAFADDAIFDVDFNMEHGAISIFFKYPIYSNRDVGIHITNYDTKETVYYNQIKSTNRGAVTVKDIMLTESGIYNVCLLPAYSEDIYEKQFVYLTEEERMAYWEMVAVNGSASDIEDNWSLISAIFELDNCYLEQIDNMTTLFDKIEILRDDSFEEMTDANRVAFNTFVKELSLFAVIEEIDDSELLAELLSDALSMNSKISYLCDEWNECMESDYAVSVLEDVMEEKGDINSFDDIDNLLNESLKIFRANKLLETIAGLNHNSKVSAIVTDEYNAELLGISDYVSDYKKLKSTSSVDKAVVKQFDSADDFAEAFKKAIEKAKKDEKENQASMPSGGSSSGSGKASIGGSGNPLVIVPDTKPDAPAVQLTFDDIDDVAWAKEHIIKLYNLGVVNGKSETEFKPFDDIKREEIVKIIVSLMNIEASSNKGNFDDVNDGAWYADYIKIASSAAIVNGMGENKFGVGLNASRQDIAVMIVNALKHKGIEIYSSAATFEDSASIATYAADSIGYLQAEGILTGDETGFFNPLKNATRAEVVTMFSRIYDKYLKEDR